MKWLAPFICLVALVFLLSACGESLQKPTGLEEADSEKEESLDYAENKDKKIALEDKEEEEKDQPSDENKETGDKDASTSTKKSTEEKSSASGSEQQSGVEKDNSSDNKKTESKNSSSTSGSKSKKNESKKEKEQKTKDKKTTKPKKGTSKDKKTTPPAEEKPKDPEQQKTIQLSIEFPGEKVILPPTTIEFEEGHTVLYALREITTEKGIQISIESSGYVSRIDNIGEKEHGPESGWMYSVNGSFPNIGAGAYKLNDGDVVKWLYTRDLGKDIGAP